MSRYENLLRLAIAFMICWTAVAVADEVSVLKADGVYHVPCELNGVLTINMVVDSGAAEVSIPADVVLRLLQAHTLSADDFLPSASYTLADGTVVRGDRFILKTLKVGATTASGVKAMIGNVGSSPLLGQSFLEKVSPWSLNTGREVLVLSGSVPGATNSIKMLDTQWCTIQWPATLDIPVPKNESGRVFLECQSADGWVIQSNKERASLIVAHYNPDGFGSDQGMGLLVKAIDRVVDAIRKSPGAQVSTPEFHRFNGHLACRLRFNLAAPQRSIEYDEFVISKPNIYRVHYGTTDSKNLNRADVQDFLASLKIK